MELTEISAFKASPKLRAKLQEISFERSFQIDEVILQEEAFVKAIPIVMNGAIRVMRTDDDGREILLYYIQAGESCIMSFLSGLHQDTSKVKAIVEEEATILFVPVDKVHLLIKEFPEWLEYIFKLYHKRFEELLAVVNEVAFRKMDERILHFLQRRVKVSNQPNIQITHEQIAKELGTSRVVVSRLLKKMEQEGLINLGRNNITLL